MIGEVGFIGLGAMGGALARRLAGQYSLVVFDTEPGRRDELVAAGAQAASSAAEVAQRASVVLTCLPTSRHVEGLLTGPGGILATLGSGGLVVDCTSGDPAATRRLAEAAREAGHALVDAPVSGGPQAAAAGSIAIMIGGAMVDVERARPVLEILSPNVRHVGPVGSGHCVKALNNLLAAAHRMLAFEAAAVVAAEGVNPQTFIEVVNMSSGRSYATQVTMPRHLFDGDLVQGFSLGLMTKDVGLAVGMTGPRLPGLGLGAEVLARAEVFLERFGPDADVNELIGAYEELAGARVAVSRRPDGSTR
ncbi:NAD(P)-dependent oxidoreductase [Pseudonocardia sp. NPDC046786]|uniref:NAD(P)-dependent oxidoreductase n=1 Tax=Pseudonocardia sp. NPDC046786 TaxID=3155471 RepID=UPI0033CA1A70